MSLRALQSKIGVKVDGQFGPATFRAAAAFLHLNDWAAVHFFAQCCHETGHFSRFEENLNYSAEGLRVTFGKYFKTQEDCIMYQRDPIRIASRVYANRTGNGDEASGDGWKFRGRGAIQLTGKANYKTFFESIGQPGLINVPDVVAESLAFESAMHFFETRGLWDICRLGLYENVIRDVTKKINGGYNGLAERIELTRKFEGYLK